MQTEKFTIDLPEMLKQSFDTPAENNVICNIAATKSVEVEVDYEFEKGEPSIIGSDPEHSQAGTADVYEIQSVKIDLEEFDADTLVNLLAAQGVNHIEISYLPAALDAIIIEKLKEHIRRQRELSE